MSFLILYMIFKQRTDHKNYKTLTWSVVGSIGVISAIHARILLCYLMNDQSNLSDYKLERNRIHLKQNVRHVNWLLLSEKGGNIASLTLQQVIIRYPLSDCRLPSSASPVISGSQDSQSSYIKGHCFNEYTTLCLQGLLSLLYYPFSLYMILLSEN